MKTKLLFSVTVFLAFSSVSQAQVSFTKGNIVVQRYGDGTATTAGTLQATFLDEYKPDGTFVRAIALPKTTVGEQRGFLALNNSVKEGVLARSADGAYLTVLGIEGAVNGNTVVNLPHVIGRISATGEVDTKTAYPYKTHTLSTGVASADGSNFYVLGARTSPATGVQLIDFELNKGKAAVTAQTDFDLGTAVGGANTSTFPFLFNNRLYYSNGNAIRAFLGPPPTTAPAAEPPAPAPSIVYEPTFVYSGDGTPPVTSQFVLFDTNLDGQPDLMYLTNTTLNTVAKPGLFGPIMKFVFADYDNDPLTPNTWVKQGAIDLPSQTEGAKFLTASLSAGVAIIYFTTIGGASTPSALYKISNVITEDLKNADLPATALVMAPVNTTFRGVAFAPFVTNTPVELTTFSGKLLKNGTVSLNWKTASENNNSHFEILRSVLGEQPSVIGKVKGANNVNVANNYFYTDQNPAVGSNYYQLNQIDNDGTADQSERIVINNNLDKAILAGRFNNRGLDLTLHSKTSGVVRIMLSDVSGKIMFSKNIQVTAGLNQQQLNVANVNAGVYVMTVIAAGEKTSIKIMK